MRAFDPVTLPSGPLPRRRAPLTRPLYPAEKTKDRGSNTIGARLNRVEDKVGARAPGRASSGGGHGPRGGSRSNPRLSQRRRRRVRAALHPGLGSARALWHQGLPDLGAHVHSPTRSRCRSPGPGLVGPLVRGVFTDKYPLVPPGPSQERLKLPLARGTGSSTPPPCALGEFSSAGSGTGVRRGELGLRARRPSMWGVDHAGGAPGQPRPRCVSRWDVGLWVLGTSPAPRPPGRPRFQQASGPLNAGASARGVLGSRGGLSRAQPHPVKSLGFRRGHYHARQLVHLHRLYLKVAGRLKIEGFAGQGLCVPFGFPGNAGLWPASIPAEAGQAGRGAAPWAPRPAASHPPHVHRPPWPGLAAGPDTGRDQDGRGRAAVQVPTGVLTFGLAS